MSFLLLNKFLLGHSLIFKNLLFPSDKPHYPYELPKGWEWTTLGNCIYVKSGNSINVRNNQTGYIPIYGGNGINGYCSTFNVEKPTLVIGRVGFNCGSIHFVTEKAWVTDNAFITTIIGNGYAPNFLRYLLEQLDLKKYANSTAQPVISGAKIYPITVPLPPYAEQQRIVNAIENNLSLIELVEKEKENMQTSIKQAKSKVLDLAIHGKLVPQDPNDEPASELLKRINPKAEIISDNGHYQKDMPFEVPNEWKWCKLKDICTFLSRGKSPKYKDEDGTYPVFAQKCNLKDGGISLKQARFLDPDTLGKWDDKYKLRNGDVLINSTGTGTVGRTRLFTEDCLGKYPFVVPDSHVSVVRTHIDVVSEFVYAYISSAHIQQYIEDNLAGSTNQKELYIGVLEEMEFPLPPLAEQKRIVAKITEIFLQLNMIEEGL